MFLLLLGFQLAEVDFKAVAKPAVLLALGRMILASLLAWLAAPFFPVEPFVRRSLILEGSVPSAVNAYILATQYQRRPDLSATALLLTTLFSLATLLLTLFLLGLFG